MAMKFLFAVTVLLAVFSLVAADTAKASHILVADEALALELKGKIDAGEDFAGLAKEHSTCPSGKSGGDLGEFGPGQMVAEFDNAVFKEAEVGKPFGPVKTQVRLLCMRGRCCAWCCCCMPLCLPALCSRAPSACVCPCLCCLHLCC